MRWRRSHEAPVENFVGGNRVELMTVGDLIFEHMLADIEAARRSVWFEMYWFASDRIGCRFIDALERAARRGVEVRLVVDAVGSFGTNGLAFERLRSAGAQFVWYNPIRPFQRAIARWTVRNHRKLLIVDGMLAFTGGLNIADAWLPYDDGGKAWRDDVVRVQGPVVRELCASFCNTWEAATDEQLVLPAPGVAHPDSVSVAVIAQEQRLEKRQALAAYLHRLRSASQSILIANAYFLPNLRIRHALVAALRRGVQLHIMVPARSDIELVRHASRGVWAKLLYNGARIYEWQPSMLHSKTAVIDSRWVTVGSFNLDYISIRSNRELNVSILDQAFAQRVEASFFADRQHCTEVDPHDFRFRSLGARLGERVAYWFRAWL